MRNIYLSVVAGFIYLSVSGQPAPVGLAVNALAPDFTAADQNGKSISLKELRKKGQVVVLFYRGNWCPYCNRQLNSLNDSLQFVIAKGATVVAITPEAAEGISKTIEKTKASFPILYDKDVIIAKAYDVSYKVEETMRTKYKDSYNVDFLKTNQQTDVAYLPVPAMYIINTQGIITYRFFDKDYSKRPSVKELLEHLN